MNTLQVNKINSVMAMSILLGFATILLPAYADVGQPTSFTNYYDHVTGELTVSGTYSGAPCDNEKRPGFAIFIDGNNPKSGASLEGAENTNTVHLLPLPCNSSGGWTDTHILDVAPSIVCVAMYDVYGNESDNDDDDDDEQLHNDIPAGSDRNKDNSYEKESEDKPKKSYGANSCTSPFVLPESPIGSIALIVPTLAALGGYMYLRSYKKILQ